MLKINNNNNNKRNPAHFYFYALYIQAGNKWDDKHETSIGHFFSESPFKSEHPTSFFFIFSSIFLFTGNQNQMKWLAFALMYLLGNHCALITVLVIIQKFAPDWRVQILSYSYGIYRVAQDSGEAKLPLTHLLAP